MGQALRLQEHLEAGKTITRVTAYQDLGIFELSARVKDLEAKGLVVERKPIKVTNRFDESVRVMVYWMEK